MSDRMAAIILAAGRGTRMHDDTLNKVCFECAGMPVVRRIVLNMKEAGVTQFVVLVGHKPKDVMDALDGIDGIVYVYQKVQNGTGHAALLGMKALQGMGYHGNSIVSMGDKVISTDVIRDYIELAQKSKAIYGVQPSGINKSGGRIAYRNGKPCGIVEFADAALMKASEMPEAEWAAELSKLGMGEGKIKKVLKKAKEDPPHPTRTLCGETFTAEELLDAPYTNVALYCFDVDAAAEVLKTCTPKNAQGEIYVTDTMEHFAAQGEAQLYIVKNRDDILTYSTKPELREMSMSFLRSAGELAAAAENGELDGQIAALLGEQTKAETRARYTKLLQQFCAKYGDEKVILARAPGRVNILGRHVDFCGGNTNVMAINRDTTLAVSPREDRIVKISNTNPAYEDFSFNIDKMLALAPQDDWVRFIESEPVRLIVNGSQGAWGNYVMAAVLRFQLETEMPLCGMNIMMDGNIPVAAGLSSSSSIVVSVAEAIVALNCLNIPRGRFIDLCGEGEWFVGTRGGAGDQAAMKCSEKGRITQLGFKPFSVGDSAKFSDKYAIILADSCIKSRKAAGSKDKFNAHVASYEISLMLMKKYFPEYNISQLRDAALLRRVSDVYRILKRLPERATRREILELLPENEERIQQLFSSHADPGTYDLRGTALFGISECARSRKCLECLTEDDYAGLGQLMQISHNGDRVSSRDGGEWPMRITDEYLIRRMEEEAELALQPGAYGCSLPEIDALCDMLNVTEGVLGSQMLGAGLGGCLAALVEADKAEKVIDKLNKEYYDIHGYEHSAQLYRPLGGSKVIF